MSSSAAAEPESKALPIVVRTYFSEVVEDDGNFIQAVCSLCRHKRKTIRGQHKAPSNFTKHVQRIHGEKYLKLMHKRKNIHCKQNGSGTLKVSEKIPKYCEPHWDPYSQYQLCDRSLSKENLDQLILNFLITDMLPLSIVDGSGFHNLIKGIIPSAAVTSTETLRNDLARQYGLVLEKIKRKLDSVSYVCTTADVWMHQGQSYVGVTCHWINSANLTRESVALSFRRFTGPCSYSKLASVLTDIHSQYDLDSTKITHIVTDNRNHFQKTFQLFSGSKEQLEDSLDQQEKNDVEKQADPPGADACVNVRIYETLSSDTIDSSDLFYLPPRVACFSCTLSFVAATAASRALATNPPYRHLFQSVASKCCALRNVSQDSLKNAELVNYALGKSLPKPASVWNSEFDSFCRIYDMRGTVNLIMACLQLPKFTNLELEFLGEWLEVMSPIATALDKLQTEEAIESFCGAVLPMVLVLNSRLESVSLKYTSCLADALKGELQKQFGHMLTFDTAVNSKNTKALVIASVSHPFFKLRWLQSQDDKKIAQELFLRELLRCDTLSPKADSQAAAMKAADDFYGFDDQGVAAAAESALRNIGVQFLNDPSHELRQLKRYPAIAKLFIKFNTTLPNSAPVEKLFCHNGQILGPKMASLQDDVLEMMMLLQKNSQFLV
ncbi:deoxyribonuclease-1-like 1 isoform X1 [Lacerta agilis]|uniref:deoxyribonuclease-1-like 1 isoform X1 n=1 Tax=Lacerta agilis TaxID=80427 RepID=UPI0014196523|nr:deoxyribonuclease-1-like 1 isoform X1 [Lacerta agilis]